MADVTTVGDTHDYRFPDGSWLRFQHGVRPDVTRNGVLATEVIDVLVEHLRKVNQGPVACRETALAITKLEEAGLWLRERLRRRQEQGVYGTMEPHE